LATPRTSRLEDTLYPLDMFRLRLNGIPARLAAFLASVLTS